jgi:hypothetical protein
MLVIGLAFVWRSFYSMRIPVDPELSLSKKADRDEVAEVEEVGV